MEWKVCNCDSFIEGFLMHFFQTEIDGVWIIEPNLVKDQRGFFSRVVCKDEFEKYGLNSNFLQQSISYNQKAGTLRGMHWQTSPYEEEKLVRCTMGAIFDVVVDIRRTSPTYKQWIGIELNAENRKQLYIPKGVAHGFLTLKDDTEVFYEITEVYNPDSARGFYWNDPEIGIVWNIMNNLNISSKDRDLPLFSEIK